MSGFRSCGRLAAMSVDQHCIGCVRVYMRFEPFGDYNSDADEMSVAAMWFLCRSGFLLFQKICPDFMNPCHAGLCTLVRRRIRWLSLHSPSYTVRRSYVLHALGQLDMKLFSTWTTRHETFLIWSSECPRHWFQWIQTNPVNLSDVHQTVKSAQFSCVIHFT